ncbi:uncharacterized protein LOC135389922 [Ornithodoros turicata]|uniref:uncharacterized protein LOC135389922 n=1 Tax=Ornithodoros turicata TaxID=34597 RepID=UPI00313964C6
MITERSKNINRNPVSEPSCKTVSQIGLQGHSEGTYINPQATCQPQLDITAVASDHRDIEKERGDESNSRKIAITCMPCVTPETLKRSLSVSTLPAQAEIVRNKSWKHLLQCGAAATDEPSRKKPRTDVIVKRTKSTATINTSQYVGSISEDEGPLDDDSEQCTASQKESKVEEKQKGRLQILKITRLRSDVKNRLKQSVAEFGRNNAGDRIDSVCHRRKASNEEDKGKETNEPSVKDGTAVESIDGDKIIREEKHGKHTTAEFVSESKSSRCYEHETNKETREQNKKGTTIASRFGRFEHSRRPEPDGPSPATIFEQGCLMRVALEANSMVRELAQSRTSGRLAELVSVITMQILNAQKGTFCISSYGIFFVLGILDMKNRLMSLEEVLNYGGFGKDGVPCCCTEVLSTLRCRGSRLQDVVVKSGLYVPRCVQNSARRERPEPSTRLSFQHVLTAEFKTNDRSMMSWNGVLFNTAAFSTTWKFPFSKKATYKGVFLSNGCEEIPAVFMRRTRVLSHTFASDLNADLVALPNQDQDVALLLLLQRSASPPITTRVLHDAVRSLRPTLVALHLPKFKITSSTELATHIQSSWNDLLNCGLSNAPAIFRSVHQRTSVSVSEGQEPSVLVERTAGFSKITTLKFNRPFIFFVYRRTPILFLYTGKVSDGSVLRTR